MIFAKAIPTLSLTPPAAGAASFIPYPRKARLGPRLTPRALGRALSPHWAILRACVGARAKMSAPLNTAHAPAGVPCPKARQHRIISRHYTTLAGQGTFAFDINVMSILRLQRARQDGAPISPSCHARCKSSRHKARRDSAAKNRQKQAPAGAIVEGSALWLRPVRPQPFTRAKIPPPEVS